MKTCAICRSSIPDAEAAAAQPKQRCLFGQEPVLCLVCAERAAQAACVSQLGAMRDDLAELEKRELQQGDGPGPWHHLVLALNRLEQLADVRSDLFHATTRRLAGGL